MYKAIDYFRKSINYCPTNVHAHVAIVNAYRYLFVLDCVSYLETLSNIEPVLAVLAKLNQSIDVVQLMYAKLKLHLEWDVRGAENRVKEALRLNPNLAEAHGLYAQLMCLLGREAEVEHQAKKMLALDPVSPISLRQVGRIFYHMEQYENAISYLEDAVELEPSDFHNLLLLAVAFAGLGDFERALRLVKKSSACQKNIETLAVTGYIEALAGNENEAMEIVDKITSDVDIKHSHPMNLARIYLALGDKQKTYELLELAFQQHAIELYGLVVDPRLKPIRTERRFIDLLCRINSAHEMPSPLTRCIP